MTRVDEFNNFYAATSARALKVTYALCGDRRVALEATVDAYRRAWRAWSKIRGHRPLEFIRAEAWHAIALSRGTHPLRRRQEDDADIELLDALGSLPANDRRLIVLMTLGDADLDEASREVGVTDEEGIEIVTNALARLEESLGVDIGEIERRMHALGLVTAQLELPDNQALRRSAAVGRRLNVVTLIAVALALVVGGGFLAAEGDAFTRNTALPHREKIGAEGPDLVLSAQALSTDTLLAENQVSQLDPSSSWKALATDEDSTNTTPYATCPPERFADPDPLRVFVRTYESSNAARVAQSIEVSRSSEAAITAYKRMVRWYADCAHPRVQLVNAWTVKRPFGDFKILRLRSHRQPTRTFTVGFSHSGAITNTLVHEINGAKGPSAKTFAQTLNDSVSRVCRASGGECTDDIRLVPTDPPHTSKAPQFLGIVDLPPVGKIDRVWAGAEPFRPTGPNPAATACDKTVFPRKNAKRISSRIFVIPQAKKLPKQFGIVETVGRFRSSRAADRFADQIGRRVQSCAGKNLTAAIGQKVSFKTQELRGTAWRISFEVEKGSTISYRMAVVRRGADVAQVTFTPARGNDISQADFAALAERAGQRLRYMSRPR